MSNHSSQFEASSGGLVLTTAILLYQGESPCRSGHHDAPGDGEPGFASIHRVEYCEKGSPTIAAGMPLSRAHLRQWTEALGRAAPPELLPDNVLVAHPDVLVWWTPARIRPAYFNLTSPPADLQALARKTIAPVPYPAHLFVATKRGLGVYALPANRRPTVGTRVFHSPILNVYVDGTLCWGNIPRPKTLGVAAIPEFERALFDSWSTHPNAGQELTIIGKGGLVGLWDDLAARRAGRFPTRRLKPFFRSRQQASRAAGPVAAEPMTVGTLVTESVRR